MHQEEFSVYFGRLEKFLSRHWDDIFIDFLPVHAAYARTREPVPYSRRLELSYQPITEGAIWGGPWESAYFHLKAELPAEWKDSTVVLYANFSGEALIFDKDGIPVFGLTGGSSFDPNYRKERYELPAAMRQSGRMDLWIEVAGNLIVGAEQPDEQHLLTGSFQPRFSGTVKKMRLARIRKEVQAFLLDYQVAFDLLAQLPREHYRSRQLMRILQDTLNVYAEDPDNAAKARAVLARVWRCHASDSALNVTAVGHAHIDTAWLWPMRETIRKCARTFANQLDLMDRYPDYVFGASSPLHYVFVKQHYPALYAKIKQRVAEGRWELLGGMWVEPDCNLISGESMIRQFLYGKNFFRDEFGVDVRNLWIPDVFGYAGSMPQIIRKSGCDSFLTQKISWNKVNRFPFHSFYWRGIDGTEVLTHFPPDNSYNDLVMPRTLIPGQNRYHEADVTDGYLCLFGIGDGGGGPSDDYVERVIRCADLEDLPKVKFGRADDFLQHLSSFSHDLPKWNGELYLEMHRGTLTTQARTKRGNRKNEQLLAAVEFLWSALPLAKYPAAELDELWKMLLSNQFHDIIPGSSIREVYERTEQEHAEIQTRCQQLLAGAAQLLGSPDPQALLLCNTLGCASDSLLEIPEEYRDTRLADASGCEVPLVWDGCRLFARYTVPAGSMVQLTCCGSKPSEILSVTDSLCLENELLRCEFTENGTLVRLFDKELNRDFLEPDKEANVFKLYADRPNEFEAWDVDVFTRGALCAEGRSAVNPECRTGKLLSFIDFSIAVGKTVLNVRASLAAGSRLLRFDCSTNWKEARKYLRVEFPVAIFASEATFDIPYGRIRRPTHRNTSWDAAKFEVVGQRFADLSDADAGIAVLNDCKYGYSIEDNVIALSLLRAPKYPDPEADQGEQRFSYALMPHGGPLAGSGTGDAAANFNRPVLAFAGLASGIIPPVICESVNVRCETVKKAEKSNALIVRLVETEGRSGEILVKPCRPFRRAVETDLMEWTELSELPSNPDGWRLRLKPFEIKTIRLDLF